MSIQTIIPENEAHWLELRSHNINSTEIASLFGASPWMSQFELWHLKAKQVHSDFVETDRTRWGKRLQLAIGVGLAEDHGFKVQPMTWYARDQESRMGASFDFEVTDQPAILETKNVDSLQFKEGWLVGDDGSIEAPPHVELQLQHQLALLPEREFGYIGALIGGNRTELLKRPRNEKIITTIRAVVKTFWASIDAGQAPPPEFPRDASFICSLYQSAAQGKCVDMTNDIELFEWALAYKELGQQCKKLEDTRDELKAHMLQRIGDADKVLLANGSISASMVQGGPVSYDRKSYRGFRVNLKGAR